MEKIFFIVSGIILFKYLLSIIFISKKLKEISYVTEVLISAILFCIVFNFTHDFYFTLAFTETEYLASKCLALINIILIKHIAFKLLISVTHDGIIAKLFYLFCDKKKFCKTVKNLQEIKYGPNLKHGIPAKARKTHAKTHVKFDRNGFPKFKSYYTFRLHFWDYKKSREFHFYKANKALFKKTLKSKKIKRLFTKAELQELKAGNTPDKYTWHHHQNQGKMQLVLRKTHATVNHIGGYSIWGGDD